MLSLAIRNERILRILKDRIPNPIEWASPSLQDIRVMTARDFSECKKDEVVKILSDGGNPDLWNYPLVKNAILKSIDKGVKVKCIIGPAAYVKNGYNFLLGEALSPNKPIEMYVTSRNEMYNYRVFGERKIWFDKYHNPLKGRWGREGKYYFNERESFSIIGFLKNYEDFESLVKVYNLKKISSINEVLLLEKSNLRRLAKYAIRNHDIFCQYDRTGLEGILAT